MSSGVHVVLKTDKGDVSVHLGPQWYLGNQDVKIEPKDTLEVIGSRAVVEGRPALIAAKVKKGEQVLELRDAAGMPRCGQGGGMDDRDLPWSPGE